MSITLHIRLDVLCPISILESVVRIFKVDIRGADVGDHDSSAVAAKAVFQ